MPLVRISDIYFENVNVFQLNLTKQLEPSKFYENGSITLENLIYQSFYIDESDIVDIYDIDLEFSKLFPDISVYTIDSDDYFYTETLISRLRINVRANDSYDLVATDYTTTRNLFVNDDNISYHDLFNFYDGYRNTSFMESNGGNLKLRVTITNTQFETIELIYTITAFYQFLYFKDAGISYYFDTALQIILPVSIIGMITIGMYSKSNSKYLAMFGYMVGIIILYLADLVSLLTMLVMLMLSMIGITILIKKGGHD